MNGSRPPVLLTARPSARRIRVRSRSATALLILMVMAGSDAQAQTATEISISGQPFGSLDEAVAAAIPGDTILLGAGSLILSVPLVLPPGVSVEGASARETLLDGSGVAVGIQVIGGVSGFPSGIRALEVSGAGRGIEISGAQGVVVRNVVLRDNQETALHVAEGAEVTLVNATLLRNDSGVVGLGVTHVRNSIITAGMNGLVSGPARTLVSSYNNLFAITGAPYVQVLRGTGDLAFPVTFRALDENDFRLTDVQVVTDRGDPRDQFTNEPVPNGARVNLGAFGNTLDAELSLPTADAGGGGCAVGRVSPPDGFWNRAGGAIAATLALLVLAARTARRPTVTGRSPASRGGCRR